jgi:two-component system, OmpR family, sensor histidine kinase CiaH
MFQQARLKLTAWYLFIIVVISLMFSFIIHSVLVREVDRFAQAQIFSIEQRLEGSCFAADGRVKPVTFRVPITPALVEETKARIFWALVLLNVGIIVMAGGFGYLLAGRTLRPIQEMVNDQHRFITDASHELKTPLTSLKTAFEVYLRSPRRSVKEADEVIKESVSEVNKLQALSESLLQLARSQRPNGMQDIEIVPISEIVTEAWRQVEPLAKKKKITLKKDFKEIHLEANKLSLQNVLVILFDNAIKYSSAKSTIKVDVQLRKETIWLMVEDKGIGISERDLGRIFDRFYRADSARSKQNANGYGLGLAIAKDIIVNHHGMITVNSQLGKGSTFIVTLPQKQPRTT